MRPTESRQSRRDSGSVTRRLGSLSSMSIWTTRHRDALIPGLNTQVEWAGHLWDIQSEYLPKTRTLRTLVFLKGEVRCTKLTEIEQVGHFFETSRTVQRIHHGVVSALTSGDLISL